jgi:hypothetical protein
VSASAPNYDPEPIEIYKNQAFMDKGDHGSVQRKVCRSSADSVLVPSSPLYTLRSRK